MVVASSNFLFHVAVEPRENDYEIRHVESARLYWEEDFGGMHVTSAWTVFSSATPLEGRSRHSTRFVGEPPRG